MKTKTMVKRDLPKKTNTKRTLRKLIVDSFAGGGGASHGITLALGRGPDLAINHDEAAIAMHKANHPDTRHMTEDVWRINPRRAVRGRRVGLLWASPDCRHFSRAKGGKPVEKKIRSLAWVVVKWAAEVKPDVIILENVREFADWGPIVPAWKCRACNWRGTEGQLTLGRNGALPLRPRCPQCEARRMVITEEMIPDPKRKGLTFRRFVGRLKAMGYVVDFKNLNAADYGAPTHRRRLFLIARRDGKPIVWPEPTHGDPKKLDDLPLFDRAKPWRTAAECIDWSIPCPSIFDRPRPLADATMRRIALGIKRYVLENPKPYIVGAGGPGYAGKPRSIDDPLGSVMKENHSALITPILVRTAQTGAGGKNCNSVCEPITTVVSKAEHCLVSPTLIQVGYGERDGQAPRVPGLDKPHGSIVSGGGKSAIVAAFLAKHFGGVVGHGVDRPIGSVTAKDHHSLVGVFLAKHFGDGHVGCPIDTPFPTITAVPNQNQIVAANLVRFNSEKSPGDVRAQAVDQTLSNIDTQNRFGLIYSFLIRYFGTAIGQHCTEPMFTITGKDRFGLIVVEVNGEPYVIADIGMRMLAPRELARAQGFPDSYLLTGTKSQQVARIGNSVCPVMAESLVRANVCDALVAV